MRRAEQEASIAEQEAQKKREAEEAKIAAEREVDLKRIAAERDIKNEDIRKAQAIEQAEAVSSAPCTAFIARCTANLRTTLPPRKVTVTAHCTAASS